MEIRPMHEADIAGLGEIDPTFTANSYLEFELDSGPSLNRSYRLVEREACPPIVGGEGYRYGSAEQEHARRKLQDGHGLMLVVEDGGKLVGVLEVEPSDWNNTATVWNILLSPSARGRGVGRELLNRSVAWAKSAGYRALMLETQSHNTPACRFYQNFGFKLAGFNTMLYTNDDIARQEVALYWALALDEMMSDE